MTYGIEGCVCCNGPIWIENSFSVGFCNCTSCFDCLKHHVCPSKPDKKPCPSRPFESLEALQKAFLEADTQDDAVFRKLIAGGWQLGVWTARDLAHFVDMSIPTAERWILGINSPHPAMRRALFKDFAELVGQKIK